MPDLICKWAKLAQIARFWFREATKLQYRHPGSIMNPIEIWNRLLASDRLMTRMITIRRGMETAQDYISGGKRTGMGKFYRKPKRESVAIV